MRSVSLLKLHSGNLILYIEGRSMVTSLVAESAEFHAVVGDNGLTGNDSRATGLQSVLH